MFPGDSCPGPRARGFDQLSRVTCDMVGDPRVDQPFQTTQARARYPTVSTSIQGDSGPCPRYRGIESRPRRLTPDLGAPGFDQRSWVTPVQVRGPTGSTSCPRGLQPGSEGLRSGPALPGHSRLRPKACGFDLLSQGNRGQVRGPEGSTSCPRGLGPVPDFQQGRSAFPDASRMCPSARGEDQQFQVLGFQGTQGDPMSLATRALFRGPMGSNRFQRRLGPVTEAPRVNQMSRATLAQLQGPAVWTSCPGPLALASKGPRGRPGVGGLGPWSEALRVRPAVTGDSSPCPRESGVHQLSPASWPWV